MINKVYITNPIGDVLVLDLFHPETNGYIVKDISGLGPVSADLKFIETATTDGGKYNYGKVGMRDLTFKLIPQYFIGGLSVEELRQEIYRYFPINQEVTIRFETDILAGTTSGIVESIDPSIFQKEESINVSIRCGDPNIYSDKTGHKTFKGVNPLFTFPFSNKSLSEKLLVFGSNNRYVSGVINYDGQFNTGFTLIIKCKGEVRGISIVQIDTRTTLKINDAKLNNIASGGLKAGDRIIINTNGSERSMQLYQNGKYKNIINAIEKPIPWFSLSHGMNYFGFITEVGTAFVEYEIEYRNAYKGI